MDNECTLWCGDFNCVRDLELDGSHLMRHNVQLERLIISTMDAWELTNVWRTLHPGEKKFTCFNKASKTLSRIDWFMASPSFMMHVVSSDIGVSYNSDHLPIYLNFTLQENDRGHGFWKMPEFLVYDAEFQDKVKEQVTLIQLCNDEANPTLLWDTMKAGIHGIALKHLAENKRKRKLQLESLESKIAVEVYNRDHVQDGDSICRYD